MSLRNLHSNFNLNSLAKVIVLGPSISEVNSDHYMPICSRPRKHIASRSEWMMRSGFGSPQFGSVILARGINVLYMKFGDSSHFLGELDLQKFRRENEISSTSFKRKHRCICVRHLNERGDQGKFWVGKSDITWGTSEQHHEVGL